jgi:hypothetical protein
MSDDRIAAHEIIVWSRYRAYHIVKSYQSGGVATERGGVPIECLCGVRTYPECGHLVVERRSALSSRVPKCKKCVDLHRQAWTDYIKKHPHMRFVYAPVQDE